MAPKAKTELRPATWQITATTIRCALVDDFVTVVMHKDWSTNCTWCNRHKKKALEDKNRNSIGK